MSVLELSWKSEVMAPIPCVSDTTMENSSVDQAGDTPGGAAVGQWGSPYITGEPVRLMYGLEQAAIPATQHYESLLP